MGRIRISEDGSYFVKDGRPFFYLADTAWMAFEKLSLKEWEEYVFKRRAQGFNVIQISMLPIAHDHSAGKQDLCPFSRKEDGRLDFFRYEEAYFQKAEEMLAILQKAGMAACLHLLWANYVPDTWASELTPDTVFPFEAVAPFVRMTAERFRRFTPLYSLSGDTSFETARVTACYREALKALKATDPECLATLHLQPRAHWPEELVEEQLDFYTYQGGHFKERQEDNGGSAAYFLQLKRNRPILNAEPPYEGHGWGNRYGRFDAYDVRKAVWQSILAGAKAGVGYGAHGVWLFHGRDDEFNNRAFSDVPYVWREALEFEGAWDVGFARWICETYRFHRLRPASLTDGRDGEVKSAASPEEDLLAVYLPYNTEVAIRRDLKGYQAVALDLDKRHVLRPDIRYGEESVVKLCECCRDVLLIFYRS